MRHELKRIEALRAANVLALVYGLLMAAFALVFLPIVLVIAIFAPSEGNGEMGPMFVVFMLVLYPVLGLVMGWISGLLMALIYNFIIRWTGGLLFDLESAPAPAETTL